MPGKVGYPSFGQLSDISSCEESREVGPRSRFRSDVEYLDPINKYGDCACFKFSLEPKPNDLLALKTSFSFGEATLELPIPRSVTEPKKRLLWSWIAKSGGKTGSEEPDEKWTVRFGVNGGELKFSLQNMQAPLTGREFVSELAVAVKRAVRKTTKDGKTSKKGIDVSGLASTQGISLSAKAQMEEVQTSSSETSIGLELEDRSTGIYTKGEDEAPSWSIRASDELEFIIGALLDCRLADLETKTIGEPCGLKGSFDILMSDIRITRLENYKAYDMSDPKNAVCRERLTRFVHRRTKGKLCEVEWSDG